MAEPQLLQDNFTRMIQDFPRDQLPADAAWYMRDFLPNMGLTLYGDYPGRLARRSGWRYASENIATDATSATMITGLFFFDRVNRLCIMTDNNKFGYVTLPGDSTNDFTLVSTSGVQSLGPWSELNGKIVIPADDGSTAPKYYDGTTFGNLAGSPPTALYTTAWKDRVILGSTDTFPNRTFFSGLDDPTTWDTTNSWINTTFDISGGYAALPNALLIFGSDKTARVRGSIPPPGSDFIIDDPIFSVGCHYPKSVAVSGGNCIFANEEGIWLTNGTSQPQDLTAMCGVKNTWQRQTLRATRVGEVSIGASVNMVTGGFIGNYYLVTTTLNAGEPALAFLFNLADKSCVLLSNFDAQCVAMTPQTGDELFFGLNDEARIFATSPIFWAGGEREDENGQNVEPVLYTRYYGDNTTNKKTWKTLYVDYYLRDPGVANPTLNVSYDTREYGNEDLGSEVSLGTLVDTPPTAHAVRGKLPIRTHSRGMGFKFTQSGSTVQTNIVAILADVHAHEGGKVV